MKTPPSGAGGAGRCRQRTRGRASATTPEQDNFRIQTPTPDTPPRPPTESEPDSPIVVLTFGTQITPLRPSTARYRQLLAMLTEAQRGAEAGGDVLAHSLYALVGVMDFLEEDPLVIRQSLDRPLNLLAHAVLDLYHGAKPALFIRKDRKPGRPKNDSIQSALGVLAACVDTIMAAGKSRRDSAHFVVTEAKRLRNHGPWKADNSLRSAPSSRRNERRPCIYGRSGRVSGGLSKSIDGASSGGQSGWGVARG